MLKIFSSNSHKKTKITEIVIRRQITISGKEKKILSPTRYILAAKICINT